MRVSAGSLKNFDEWMQMYEASMSERVYKKLDSSRDAGASKAIETYSSRHRWLFCGCKATVPGR